MNHSVLRRRNMRFIHFVICLFLANVLFAQNKIEGLSYIDGKPISVEIKDGKIVKIRSIKKVSGNNKVYIAPSLIDNQVNRFNGVSFSFGGGELTNEGVVKATKALWERGVTTYLPTLTTNSKEVLLKNFSTSHKTMDCKELFGSIPGFHLEVPYISPVDGYRGAHIKKFVRKPDWNEFMEFYDASGGNILTVTVTPEIEGAMDFIKKCSDMGMAVALGHHNGTAEQINEVTKNNAKTCTHLGNGCTNMINRHNNSLWPQLANDDLMSSIICDDFHLRPEEISVFTKAKGIDKTIITSDVTKYAGLKPGIYNNIGGDDLELTKEGKVQYPVQKVLAGSAYTSNGIVDFLKEIEASLSENITKVFFRADGGFFSEKLFDLLESFCWDYLIKV